MGLLDTFDGLESRTIFCLWTGDEIMSENRLIALWSIFNNTGVSIAFVTKNNMQTWEHPQHKFHPAFKYLSSTHKADYLRCYLMHIYGGGYTDIKKTYTNWAQYFDIIHKSHKIALGYEELAHGIPHVPGTYGDMIRSAHSELIGLCAFIFKKNTYLTHDWLIKTEQVLDEKLPLLEKNPAQHPLDQKGVILPNGTYSEYPLRWAEILGEIFHPIIYENRGMLIKAPINPVFTNYR